jgi:hypothetical protein
MERFQDLMNDYSSQMKLGIVPKAYKGLMEYILGLRTHFANKYADYSVANNIYFGYMDMTYFSLVPEELKKRKLKIAVVFIHESCRFEAWLAAANKQIQSKYWELFKKYGWDKYKLVPTIQGYDSILEQVLVDNPDFDNLDALTEKIEKGAIKFTDDIISFLSSHDQ